MDQAQMRRYLVDKKEAIRSLLVKERAITVERTRDFITAVIGPRRAGKTYYLYDLILNRYSLKDEDYLFMNLEDVDLDGVTPREVKEAIGAHEQAYGKRPAYIFLDEVQTLKGWEKAVNSLYETKQYFIFLSGSSSRLLSREMASLLRGRSMSYVVLPLSFKEFLEFRGSMPGNHATLTSSGESQVKRSLESYLRLGGFPDVATNEGLAERFHRDYLDMVVYRDLIERYGIKNTALVRFLIASALSSFGKPLSAHKLFNTAKSKGMEVSKSSIYTYLGHLEESFFLFLLRKYSPSAREHEGSLPKLYLNDVGMRDAVASPGDDIGRAYENAVFLELKRLQNASPQMGLSYYSVEPQGYEVDFVVAQRSKVKQLIQVAYELDSAKGREVRALLHASSALRCKDLLVITHEREGTERVKWFGTERTVRFTPLWKWLLGQ